MKKILSSSLALILSVGLLTSCTNNEMGTTGGAALGGLAGYGLTGGSGVGAAVGAVGGGLIGNATIH